MANAVARRASARTSAGRMNVWMGSLLLGLLRRRTSTRSLQPFGNDGFICWPHNEGAQRFAAEDCQSETETQSAHSLKQKSGGRVRLLCSNDCLSSVPMAHRQ